MSMLSVIRTVGLCWRTGVLVVTPLALSPLLIFFWHDPPTKCAFLVLVMAIYWSTEALPVPVTALMPVFMLPILGLLSSEEACKPYLQEPNMVFVGSLIFAIAVESSRLHKRIALQILKRIGTNFEHLMLGFMFTTMLVAMWIINTAAAAMMLPIADAILDEMFPAKDIISSRRDSRTVVVDGVTDVNENGNETENGIVLTALEIDEDCSRKPSEAQISHLKKMFYLSIAYSANIGGTSTLTSNGPNLILRFVLDNTYKGHTPVDYTSWFLFNAPAAIITVFLVWVAFRQMYLRKVPLPAPPLGAKDVMQRKYHELGPLTFPEVAVLVLFFALVSLWMLRDPSFIKGWATYFGSTQPKDATVAIFIALLLFIVPIRPLGPFPSPSILDWPTVQQKLAWGVIILRGGGFSMANAVNKSGLSAVMGTLFARLDFMSLYGIVMTFSAITAFMTEFASNSAVASVLLPISAQLAVSLHANPLILLVPITLSCSYAFILPVGTPANALVFEHAKLASKDMLLPGLVTQTICLFIMWINMITLGPLIFDLNDPSPQWAKDTKF